MVMITEGVIFLIAAVLSYLFYPKTDEYRFPQDSFGSNGIIEIF